MNVVLKSIVLDLSMNPAWTEQEIGKKLFSTLFKRGHASLSEIHTPPGASLSHLLTGYAKITLHFAGSHLENRYFQKFPEKNRIDILPFFIMFSTFWDENRCSARMISLWSRVRCTVKMDFSKHFFFFWNFQKVKPKVKNLFGKVKKKLKKFWTPKKVKVQTI